VLYRPVHFISDSWDAGRQAGGDALHSIDE